ncbi:MAG: ATP-binding protein [Desulfobacterales bacterium]|nr:ATP-binding protein [Desulfobacterales bacterium]
MKDNSLKRRIRWLMLLRVVIATFLLGIATFIRIKAGESSSQTAYAPIYFIVALTYLFSFTCLFIPKIIKNNRVNIYLQSFLDVLLITGLVYVTGGIESIYSVLYPLVIIYSALFLAGRGGLISASACSIFYGMLLDLEYYGIIRPIYQWDYNYDCDAGYVFSRIFVHIISFYIIALLTSYAVKQEQKTRELLAEKESAFDQLDLLHKSIIESVNTGILTVDLHRNIKSFNTEAEKITGFLHSEIINKKIYDVFPVLSKMLDKEVQLKNGSRLEVADSGKIMGCSISPLVDGNKEKIGDILIFQDLTVIKEMEANIERNKRLAFVGEMAAGLAHEIRNPLASISGPIQMLSKDLNLDETDRRLMQIILSGKDRLEGFVKDFLLLARPKQSERKNIDVKAVIDDVLESLRFSPEWSEDIEVNSNLCDHNNIYGNKAEIRQVILNLILNAVQAMPEKGILKIETRQVFNDGKKYLEILISDNGCGIEAKNQDKVFEPFYTTKKNGTGLGMAIVNSIVESHMGKITIKSEQGKGTDCVVLLPQEEILDGEDSRC